MNASSSPTPPEALRLYCGAQQRMGCEFDVLVTLAKGNKPVSRLLEEVPNDQLLCEVIDLIWGRVCNNRDYMARASIMTGPHYSCWRLNFRVPSYYLVLYHSHAPHTHTTSNHQEHTVGFVRFVRFVLFFCFVLFCFFFQTKGWSAGLVQVPQPARYRNLPPPPGYDGSLL
jgi:hypothetical protein